MFFYSSVSEIKEVRRLARNSKTKTKTKTKSKRMPEAAEKQKADVLANESNLEGGGKLSKELDESFEGSREDDIKVVPEPQMSPKDQGARLLEIRRAIEERMDQRKIKDDLDYLDGEA